MLDPATQSKNKAEWFRSQVRNVGQRYQPISEIVEGTRLNETLTSVPTMTFTFVDHDTKFTVEVSAVKVTS